ncbi:MAG: hypothetical protein HYY17_16280 [Planctomycetes bacterium]|nr:hypothetical protein [Planctomycetota bacterium]
MAKNNGSVERRVAALEKRTGRNERIMIKMLSEIHAQGRRIDDVLAVARAQGERLDIVVRMLRRKLEE